MSILSVENIVKHYKNIKAVDGVSLNLEKGEIIGLLGPNGAGKSTTISMIATLIEQGSGEIYYKDKDINQIKREYQSNIGVVPQEISLYPNLTGMENLKFWGSIYGLKGKVLNERIEEISKLIGIDERLKHKVETYSGGMKRRVNIGAALLHQPEILIMDEPTVGIDPQSRNHILDTVKILGERGMSIIYTSHYMEEVDKLCSRIYIMDEGRIISEGTKKQLIDQIGNNHTLKIKFKNKSELVAEKVLQLNSVSKVTWVENTLEILVNNGDEVIADIIVIAQANQNSIKTIDIVETDLETVFLKLTGKALRD